jgi:hypothetical protein
MRIFYAFWFFICAGWGFLLSSMPIQEADTLTNIIVTFPVSLVAFAALAFISMRKATPPGNAARLNVGLKPWQSGHSESFSSSALRFYSLLFGALHFRCSSLGMKSCHHFAYSPCHPDASLVFGSHATSTGGSMRPNLSVNTEPCKRQAYVFSRST